MAANVPLGGSGTELSPAGPDHAASTLAHPVKLVIWDLDDTLWDGTLSEGPVVLAPGRAEVVRTLNRRGIVNSICSKNDRSAVEQRLGVEELWEEFVFVRVSWEPKGAQVAGIIEDAELRPENVLFIDDRAANLGEAAAAAPGLQTAGPEIIPDLLRHPETAGKDDRDLSRLRQYRVLEQKSTDRASSDISHEDFLRSCDIRVSMLDDVVTEEERLYELVLRTNQLNFTKRRPGRDEFGAMLRDPAVECGAVRVRDRYGDYGICGFFAVREADRRCLDLLYSCRILHMGVEQWVYDHLGRPELEIEGEVVASLTGPTPDWIRLDDGGPAPGDEWAPERPGSAGSSRTLLVGGCDLMAVADFVGGDVSTDFSRVLPSGGPMHVEHTVLLRASAQGATEQQLAVVDRLPFLDRTAFRSPVVVGADYELLVYSALMDYTQALYRHRGTGLVVPWLHLDIDATDPDSWSLIYRRFPRVGATEEFLTWFSSEFEFLGPISSEEFQDNLRWLAGEIPPEARMIVLNGAEIELDHRDEPDRHLRHMRMNAALEEVVAELPNASVCDVRSIVTSRADLSGDLRHYQRRCYLGIAHAIQAGGAGDLRPHRDHWTTVTLDRLRRETQRQWRRAETRWRMGRSGSQRGS